MLKRVENLNVPYHGPAHEGCLQLERDGHYVLRGEFDPSEVAALRAEIQGVYRDIPPDARDGRTSPENAEMFRYEMFNRSALCQSVIQRPNILAIVEPLLGDNCHAISCTAWRNPPGNGHAPRGQEWHIDSGPHVPFGPDVEWPDAIPFPIFVIGTHIYLEDLRLENGPTAFVPGSHRSGSPPPKEHEWDAELSFRGRESVHHEAKAGDVGFFVSDVWHRRLPPSPASSGRFFLQTNYGRRDIAQRIRPASEVNHVSPEAQERATNYRGRLLIGLHPQTFYDG
ncbi:MAG: phytanoyl-CoA dioxygenase family protein [Planctomycetota bacterium]|nr:phytanoyl-CoA dioxygenase family protein [Planctomycetota bacterium]